MTFKQGGNSWNGSPQGKKGVQTRYKCDICRREYKIEQHRDTHEKLCRQYEEAKNRRERGEL